MYKIVLLFFISLSMSMHGQWSLSGSVVNESSNSPLIGCAVYNVTQQLGTITNEDGQFNIYAKKGDLIQFSFTGMAIVERYVVDSSELSIRLNYQSRKIKPVIIASDNKAKNSVLYNKNYIKNRRVQQDPVARTAKEKIKQSGFKSSQDFNNPGVNISLISLLYYSNKKVQRRLQAIVDINKLEASQQKYSLDFISLVTKIDDIDELKDIKAYCYFPHDQVLNSTYYDLGLMLQDCYIKYLEDKKLKPKPVAIPANDSLPKD